MKPNVSVISIRHWKTTNWNNKYVIFEIRNSLLKTWTALLSLSLWISVYITVLACYVLCGHIVQALFSVLHEKCFLSFSPSLSFFLLFFLCFFGGQGLRVSHRPTLPPCSTSFMLFEPYTVHSNTVCETSTQMFFLK